MRIVVVTGGFDPLHSGHIAYFEAAKAMGHKLVVGINSDVWLERKKGRPFMPVEERENIVSNLKMVDQTFAFSEAMDRDDSCCEFLRTILDMYPNDEIIFANGGDRTNNNIPEMSVDDDRLSFEFSVGGNDKKNSSSWILREWKHTVEKRGWGEFVDLFQDDSVRVKELVIEPGQGISYQRHFKRSEIWFVSKGIVNVKHSLGDPDKYQTHTLSCDDLIHIRHGQWHQAYNPFDVPCHIIEIQYGEKTSEDDIERLEYYNGEIDSESTMVAS